ncbi:MAG TPA: phosphoribosyltransferase family protein, partial [Thermomicrobiales bacterium]|nr:phosphoribosyltransferase family protein [Thermomicrobiales bacterium]
SDAAACRAGRVIFDEVRIHERIDQLAASIAADTQEPNEHHRVSITPAPSRSSHDSAPQAIRLPIWQVTGPTDVVQPAVRHEEADLTNRAPLLVLGVDRGSAVFAHHLAAAIEGIGVAIDRDRVTLTRHRTPQGERRVRIERAPRTPVAGRRVLVVTDVVSTGLSLAYLARWLERRGALQVDTCTLLDRRAARLLEVLVRYVGFEAPNELLVGFGLHLRRQFRHLPFIASLVSEPVAQLTD